jgi:hypothetical protein
VCDQRVSESIDAARACLSADHSLGWLGLSMSHLPRHLHQQPAVWTLAFLTSNPNEQVSAVKAHPNQFGPDKLLDVPTTGPGGACYRHDLIHVPK